MILTLDEIRHLVLEEEAEDLDTIHLTSNETVLSPLAQTMMASPLGNRYLLEHSDMRQDSPSRLNGFIYRGLNRVNAIEKSATEVCNALKAAAVQHIGHLLVVWREKLAEPVAAEPAPASRRRVAPILSKKAAAAKTDKAARSRKIVQGKPRRPTRT